LALAGKPESLVVFPYECFEFAAFRSLEMPTLSIAREGFEIIVENRFPDYVYSVRRRSEWSYISIKSRNRGIISGIRLRSVSAGMISNMVLSIVAALELGVESSVVAERVDAWAPAKMRGQVIHKNDSLYYIDCYNANPDSMSDAIKTFSGLTDERTARIYFIGCMEELGEESDDLHFSLGQSWTLSEEDQVVIMGSQAEALRDGLLKAGNRSDKVNIVSDIDSAKSYLDGFKGAVFLKGSRRYHLEEIVGVDTLLKEERADALC
jgi:UDP-N-acetylmuramoyl-tripeptide--D-alanyl-D-alanine ligase